MPAKYVRAPLTVAAIVLLSLPFALCSVRDHSGATSASAGVARAGSSEAAVSSREESVAVVNWRREGGFAGFCDEMSITAAGEIRTESCRGASGPGVGRLSREDLTRLRGWMAAFGTVEIQSKDSGLADAMTVTLTLRGSGNGQPTETQKNEILDWAQRIFADNQPPR